MWGDPTWKTQAPSSGCRNPASLACFFHACIHTSCSLLAFLLLPCTHSHPFYCSILPQTTLADCCCGLDRTPTKVRAMPMKTSTHQKQSRLFKVRNTQKHSSKATNTKNNSQLLITSFGVFLLYQSVTPKFCSCRSSADHQGRKADPFY